MIAGKFMDAKGGTTANAVKAIDYFIDLKSRGVNVVAINCSWGSSTFSQALYDAVNRTRTITSPIVFVASAGNGGSDGVGDDDKVPFYPACFTFPADGIPDNIISVAAINQSGAMYLSSNYGIKNVDLGAPGARIWTTISGNTWNSYSGTSVATAYVTGAAALYAASHPVATVDLIKGAIMDAAKSTPTLSVDGKCVTGGRLNVSTF
ncbi:MAG: hypothetical protein NVSMB30_31930 [Hymenobacter sp.]